MNTIASVQNSRERYIIEMYTNHGAIMHHIKTDDVEYAFPSSQFDLVIKLIRHLSDTKVKYLHYFID